MWVSRKPSEISWNTYLLYCDQLQLHQWQNRCFWLQHHCPVQTYKTSIPTVISAAFKSHHRKKHCPPCQHTSNHETTNTIADPFDRFEMLRSRYCTCRKLAHTKIILNFWLIPVLYLKLIPFSSPSHLSLSLYIYIYIFIYIYICVCLCVCVWLHLFLSFFV